MVLAGENSQSRPRTNHAILVHNEIGHVHGSRIPIYFAGSHSGLNGIYLPKGKLPLCEQMRQYALKKGVNDKDIILETPRRGVGSLDTLANFVFADNIIPKHFSTIGFFTELPHIPRASFCSKIVFGDTPFYSFGSEPDILKSHLAKVQEKLTLFSLILDFKNIQKGDMAAIQKYMEITHPFHAITHGNKPSFSFYGAMVYFGRALNSRSKEKSEFFQDS